MAEWRLFARDGRNCFGEFGHPVLPEARHDGPIKIGYDIKRLFPKIKRSKDRDLSRVISRCWQRTKRMPSTTDTDDNVEENLRKSHLDWTAKQGRILTANGRAPEYFSGNFRFTENELPHHHLQRQDTRQAFRN